MARISASKLCDCSKDLIGRELKVKISTRAKWIFFFTGPQAQNTAGREDPSLSNICPASVLIEPLGLINRDFKAIQSVHSLIVQKITFGKEAQNQ